MTEHHPARCYRITYILNGKPVHVDRKTLKEWHIANSILQRAGIRTMSTLA